MHEGPKYEKAETLKLTPVAHLSRRVVSDNIRYFKSPKKYLANCKISDMGFQRDWVSKKAKA